MSSYGDGVSKFFLVYHDMSSMNFHGEKTLDDLALHAMRMESYRPGYRERLLAHITDLGALLATYDFESTHEHDWIATIVGDEEVGQHCADERCGATKEE